MRFICSIAPSLLRIPQQGELASAGEQFTERTSGFDGAVAQHHDAVGGREQRLAGAAYQAQGTGSSAGRRRDSFRRTDHRRGAARQACDVSCCTAPRATDLRGIKTFHRDYPEATPLLLYRGSETLERDGIRCVPVDRFLRELVPGRDLPR